MGALNGRLVAPDRDNEFCERLSLTSQQSGLVGFTFSRAGYSAVKTEVDAVAQTIFGIRFFIVDCQRERARAWWTAHDLSAYLRTN